MATAILSTHSLVSQSLVEDLIIEVAPRMALAESRSFCSASICGFRGCGIPRRNQPANCYCNGAPESRSCWENLPERVRVVREKLGHWGLTSSLASGTLQRVWNEPPSLPVGSWAARRFAVLAS